MIILVFSLNISQWYLKSLGHRYGRFLFWHVYNSLDCIFFTTNTLQKKHFFTGDSCLSNFPINYVIIRKNPFYSVCFFVLVLVIFRKGVGWRGSWICYHFGFDNPLRFIIKFVYNVSIIAPICNILILIIKSFLKNYNIFDI